MKRAKAYIPLTLMAVFVVTSVIMLERYQKAQSLDVSKMHMTVLSTPRDIKPFELKDGNQQSYTNAQLHGHWSILFFGFTRCAMLCPTTMAKLNHIDLQLKRTHTRIRPQVLMITLDPTVDTPEHIQAYAANFNKHFIGLWGEQHIIDTLARELGIASFTETLKNRPQASINHSGALTVIDPMGRVYGFYPSDVHVAAIVEDFSYMSKRL